MITNPTPYRGEVWRIRFDPAEGDEIKKVRTAVVISENAVGRLRLKIVVPITEWKPRSPNSPSLAVGTISSMSFPRAQLLLLLKAGRMLLEYNESSAGIHRALTETAVALTGETCQVEVSYGCVAVSLGREGPAAETVHELHYNVAVKARVHEILEQVRLGRLRVDEAVGCLERVVAETGRHAGWLVACVLGIAALSLARLLGADLAAAGTAGLATALGLLIRLALGRHHFSLLSLPFAAAFLGALLGGCVIRLGWTDTPELAVVVPALMVIPGPHFLYGITDLIDNYVPMSLARFALAAGILLASAAGIVLGVELILPDAIAVTQMTDYAEPNFLAEIALAGIVTCGFAVYYNTAWRHLWLAVVGGMAGHGLRFVALDLGYRLEAATFLGGLAVGLLSAWNAGPRKLPVATIAFAGAVTMIPGLSLYRSLIGAVQLARTAARPEPAILAGTVANALHCSVVVAALALGLILGMRAISWLTDKRPRKKNLDAPQH